ncbi:uncharacterized protein V6R79_018039 [Siganus canaliculatus]
MDGTRERVLPLFIWIPGLTLLLQTVTDLNTSTQVPVDPRQQLQRCLVCNFPLARDNGSVYSCKALWRSRKREAEREKQRERSCDSEKFQEFKKFPEKPKPTPDFLFEAAFKDQDQNQNQTNLPEPSVIFTTWEVLFCGFSSEPAEKERGTNMKGKTKRLFTDGGLEQKGMASHRHAKHLPAFILSSSRFELTAGDDCLFVKIWSWSSVPRGFTLKAF